MISLSPSSHTLEGKFLQSPFTKSHFFTQISQLWPRHLTISQPNRYRIHKRHTTQTPKPNDHASSTWQYSRALNSCVAGDILRRLGRAMPHLRHMMWNYMYEYACVWEALGMARAFMQRHTHFGAMNDPRVDIRGGYEYGVWRYICWLGNFLCFECG